MYTLEAMDIEARKVGMLGVEAHDFGVAFRMLLPKTGFILVNDLVEAHVFILGWDAHARNAP